MNFSVNELSALLKTAAASPGDSKALLKFVTLDVLKSLGENRYQVDVGGKQLQASSEQNLQTASRYWGMLDAGNPKALKLSQLLQLPKLALQLAALPPRQFSPEQLAALLRQENPAASLKGQLLEQLATAGGKEEFTAATQLLLSLHANVLTVPLFYDRFFGFFQMKKRYNKQSQKRSVEFYAALHHLGPVEGTLSLDGEGVRVELRVLTQSTLNHLRSHADQLPAYLHLAISLADTLQPLWESSDGLLDINA